jgi:hypothetical protein
MTHHPIAQIDKNRNPKIARKLTLNPSLPAKSITPDPQLCRPTQRLGGSSRPTDKHLE